MIRTEGLTKRFGRITAVDEVDLDVREGDVYGFLGANGSGKTTTVRMLLGLVLATSGRMEVLGEADAAGRAAGAAAGRRAGRGAGGVPAPVGAAQPRALRRDGAGRRPRRTAPRPGRPRRSSGSGWPRSTSGRSARTRSACGSGSALAGALLRRPAAAGPRRADQRPRPAGHPGDPRAAARPQPDRAPRSSSPATCSPRSSRCAPGSACSTAAGWSSRPSSPSCAGRPAGSRCTRPDVAQVRALLDGVVEEYDGRAAPGPRARPGGAQRAAGRGPGSGSPRLGAERRSLEDVVLAATTAERRPVRGAAVR